MEGMTLDEILEQSIVHEDHAPLHVQLRRSVHMSAVATGAAIPIGLFGATMLAQSLGGIWGGLGGLVVLPLMLLASPLGLIVNVLAVLTYGWLWYATDGLEEGHLIWHKVGVALAAIGAFNVLAVILPIVWAVASIALTFVMWLAVSILVIVGFLFFLGVAVFR